MAQALQHAELERQLALYDMPAQARGGDTDGQPLDGQPLDRQRARVGGSGDGRRTRLCAGCRGKEARYGFRADRSDAAGLERPRALCFECFRAEIDRRRTVSERMARGWNAEQVGLPLDETLERLTRRRRRAQIAARHALGLS